MSVSALLAIGIFAAAVIAYVLYRKRRADGGGRVSWRPGKKE